MLLKNEKALLPIDLSQAKRILVVGENAVKMMTVGGGSSSLKVQREVSPLDGIRERVGNQAEVRWVRGYVGDASGEYNGVVSGQNLKDDRSPQELTAEAVEAARNADYVIFIGGLNKSAGQDCEDSAALAKANPKLVVVNISGNAIAMPWVKEVPAIVQDWYIGSEAGHALASVLMGDVNPSGKLPFTFPVRLEDSPAHAVGDYTGERSNETVDVEYKEGILVGYRWHDTKRIKPLFPFGHGLSYTTFSYGKATIDSSVMKADGKLTVTVPVTNTGSRPGAEVVQLYIHDVKSALPRPQKELKGFYKVQLQPGETREVTFTIDREALSYYDDNQSKWVAEPGKFEAIVAASATDIRSTVPFRLEE